MLDRPFHVSVACRSGRTLRPRRNAAVIATSGTAAALVGAASHLRRPVTSTVPDLIRARDTIEAAGGASVRWFRPPYGAVSSATLVAARRARLQLVLWTTWGLDTTYITAMWVTPMPVVLNE